MVKRSFSQFTPVELTGHPINIIHATIAYANPLFTAHKKLQLHVYSPSCLGQETAKEPFGLPSQATTCPPHTPEASHYLFSLLNAKQGSCEYKFLVFGLIQLENESESTVSLAEALSTRLLIGIASWVGAFTTQHRRKYFIAVSVASEIFF